METSTLKVQDVMSRCQDKWDLSIAWLKVDKQPTRERGGSVSKQDPAIQDNSSAFYVLTKCIGGMTKDSKNSCTELDLSCNIFSNEAIEALARSLCSNETIRTLSLRSVGSVTNSANTKPAQQLQHTGIGMSGFIVLAAAVGKNTCLTQLDVSENTILVDGAAGLCDALTSNSSLKFLSVRNCSLGDDGIAALCGFLPKNKTLTHLDISDNKCGPKGIEAFSACLVANGSLEVLVADLNSVGRAGDRFCFSVGIHQKLKSASLVHMNLSAKHICQLFAAMYQNQNSAMTSLNLQENELDDDAFFALMVVLQSNTNLMKLDLGNAQVCETSAKYLALGLTSNRTVQDVNLFLNSVGLLGSRALACSLVANPALRSPAFSTYDLQALRSVFPSAHCNPDIACRHVMWGSVCGPWAEANEQLLTNEVICDLTGKGTTISFGSTMSLTSLVTHITKLTPHHVIGLGVAPDLWKFLCASKVPNVHAVRMLLTDLKVHDVVANACASNEILDLVVPTVEMRLILEQEWDIKLMQPNARVVCTIDAESLRAETSFTEDSVSVRILGVCERVVEGRAKILATVQVDVASVEQGVEFSRLFLTKPHLINCKVDGYSAPAQPQNPFVVSPHTNVRLRTLSELCTDLAVSISRAERSAASLSFQDSLTATETPPFYCHVVIPCPTIISAVCYVMSVRPNTVCVSLPFAHQNSLSNRVEKMEEQLGQLRIPPDDKLFIAALHAQEIPRYQSSITSTFTLGPYSLSLVACKHIPDPPSVATAALALQNASSTAQTQPNSSNVGGGGGVVGGDGGGGGSGVADKGQAQAGEKQATLLNSLCPAGVTLCDVVRDALARLPASKATKPEVVARVVQQSCIVRTVPLETLTLVVGHCLKAIQDKMPPMPATYDPVNSTIWPISARHRGKQSQIPQAHPLWGAQLLRMCSPALRKIDLFCNGITPEEISAWQLPLHTNEQLCVLNLSGNNMTEQICGEFARTIDEWNFTVERIIVDGRLTSSASARFLSVVCTENTNAKSGAVNGVQQRRLRREQEIEARVQAEWDSIRVSKRNLPAGTTTATQHKQHPTTTTNHNNHNNNNSNNESDSDSDSDSDGEADDRQDLLMDEDMYEQYLIKMRALVVDTTQQVQQAEQDLRDAVAQAAARGNAVRWKLRRFWETISNATESTMQQASELTAPPPTSERQQLRRQLKTLKTRWIVTQTALANLRRELDGTSGRQREELESIKNEIKQLHEKLMESRALEKFYEEETQKLLAQKAKPSSDKKTYVVPPFNPSALTRWLWKQQNNLAVMSSPNVDVQTAVVFRENLKREIAESEAAVTTAHTKLQYEAQQSNNVQPNPLQKKPDQTPTHSPSITPATKITPNEYRAENQQLNNELGPLPGLPPPKQAPKSRSSRSLAQQQQQQPEHSPARGIVRENSASEVPTTSSQPPTTTTTTTTITTPTTTTPSPQQTQPPQNTASPTTTAQQPQQPQQPQQQQQFPFDSEYEISMDEISLKEKIGVGQFGDVFKAEYQGGVVAVKVLKNQKLTEGALEEFRRELSVIKSLRHPNVLLFMGASTKSEQPCLVTEYCSQGSLFQVLRHPKNKDMGLKRKVNMALDVARGMNHLHLHKPPIVHRDLKSLNLLVDDHFHIKVADFGLSREIDTYMTSQAGTYHWMAPEVIKHSGNYTTKADVYSFGIVLWEIVTQQEPHPNLDGVQVALQVMTHELRPEIPTNCPPQLSSLMKQCWHANPQDRPTFQVIVDRLTEYLASLP